MNPEAMLHCSDTEVGLNFQKEKGTSKINVSRPIHLHEGGKHAGGTNTISKASTTEVTPELSGT
jgi:hypothetical protein